MRVLFVTHHWTTNSHHSKHSGYQRLVPFAATNNDVTVLTWGDEDRTERPSELANFTTVTRCTPKGSIRKRVELSRVAAKMAGDFDVVHTLYSDCGYHLAKGVKFVTTLHVHPAIVRYTTLRKNLFLKIKHLLVVRRVLRSAARVFCVSRNLVETLPATVRRRAVLVPHGVDTTFWNQGSAPVSDVASSLLRGGKFRRIALTVGSHGIDYRCLLACVKRMPDVLFVGVGTELEFAADNLMLKSNITDEELRDLYQAADVFFRPLRFATANNSILEAMSTGAAIVATDLASVRDYLGAGDAWLVANNYLFPQALEEVLNAQGSERRSRGGDARRHAIEEFSWDAVTDQLLSEYQSVL